MDHTAQAPALGRNNTTGSESEMITSTNTGGIYGGAIAAGATDNYVPKEIAHLILSNIRLSPNPTTVTLPDKTQLESTHEGDLPLSKKLSKEARTAIIVPHLRTPFLAREIAIFTFFKENTQKGHKMPL